jgi:hypothetical protein
VDTVGGRFTPEDLGTNESDGEMVEGDTSQSESRNEDVEDQTYWIKAGWEQHDIYSGKLSDVARNLALIGFALTLLIGGAATDDFRERNGEAIDLPITLIVSGVLLILALTFDLMQYTYASIAYNIWTRREEKTKDRDPKAYRAPDGFPDKLSWPTMGFFYSKVLLVATAYGILLWHLAFVVK